MGMALTKESVKQTIIMYLPATANIHPVVGVVAGAICIFGAQILGAEAIRDGEDDDDGVIDVGARAA